MLWIAEIKLDKNANGKLGKVLFLKHQLDFLFVGLCLYVFLKNRGYFIVKGEKVS